MADTVAAVTAVTKAAVILICENCIETIWIKTQ
jgi:hypothetical protein